jgi:hypothetical protein
MKVKHFKKGETMEVRNEKLEFFYRAKRFCSYIDPMTDDDVSVEARLKYKNFFIDEIYPLILRLSYETQVQGVKKQEYIKWLYLSPDFERKMRLYVEMRKTVWLNYYLLSKDDIIALSEQDKANYTQWKKVIRKFIEVDIARFIEPSKTSLIIEGFKNLDLLEGLTAFRYTDNKKDQLAVNLRDLRDKIFLLKSKVERQGLHTAKKVLGYRQRIAKQIHKKEYKLMKAENFYASAINEVKFNSSNNT